MRGALLVLLIILALSVPKTWNAIKGADSHLFSKTFVPTPSGLKSDVTTLAQPFYYWGKGSQFYVYLSKDGLYVLKIPRASKMRESLIDRVLRRKMKKPDPLTSMQIAHDHLALQTGLLAVHLGSWANDPIPAVLLYDRIHRGRAVDLNCTPFALQRRQKLLSAALEDAADLSESKQILMAYLDLIGLEKKSGWMSHDCAFWQNFGFENGQALRLDIGSYVPVDDDFSWSRITKPVLHWLKNSNSLLSDWFEQEIEHRERL